MSHRLYFCGTDSPRPWFAHGVIPVSFLLHRLMPVTSTSIVRKMMSTPSRRPGYAASAGFSKADRSLVTAHGELALYERGDGPVVLLQHGWSGSADQMKSLVEQVARSGFRAVAFDQYRHGRSGGRDVNLALFVRAAEAVVARLRAEGHRIVGSVAHSIGCTTALHCGLGADVAHFMVAPLLDPCSRVRHCADVFGIHPRQVDALFAAVEQDYAFDHSTIDDARAASLLRHPVQIVHSLDDPVSPFATSRELQRRIPKVRVKPVPGRSHVRLLRDAGTRKLLAAWLEGLAHTAPQAAAEVPTAAGHTDTVSCSTDNPPPWSRQPLSVAPLW